MKKTIVISLCALLGLAAGYFAAGPASMWYIQSTEPDMFGAFAFTIVNNSIACTCKNTPPNEALKTVSDGLSTLRGWRDQDRSSLMLAQEIGLAYVRLSQLEQKRGDNVQADSDMKHGQHKLAALGWKDVSPAHLTALVKRMDSPYQAPDQNEKAAAVAR